MRSIRQMTQKMLLVIGFGLGLGFVAATASASPTMPQNGVEYTVLDRPQPAEGGKKVEVIEFFGYFCPHCNALEPVIAAWVKKQGDNIVFKRIHVNFHDLVTQQKLYYTLEAMGKTEEFHAKAFAALHIERNRLQSDADIMEFVTKSGLDKQKFMDVYNSFAVQSKVNRSAQMQDAYRIDSVPMFAVDGRYMTGPAMAAKGLGRVTEDAQNVAGIQVLDFLFNKVLKDKNAPAAAAPAASKVTPAAPAAKDAAKKK